MPFFRYVSMSKSGRISRGKHNAFDHHELVNTLWAKEQFLIYWHEEGDTPDPLGGAKAWFKSLKFNRKWIQTKWLKEKAILPEGAESVAQTALQSYQAREKKKRAWALGLTLSSVILVYVADRILNPPPPEAPPRLVEAKAGDPAAVDLEKNAEERSFGLRNSKPDEIKFILNHVLAQQKVPYRAEVHPTSNAVIVRAPIEYLPKIARWVQLFDEPTQGQTAQERSFERMHRLSVAEATR